MTATVAATAAFVAVVVEVAAAAAAAAVYEVVVVVAAAAEALTVGDARTAAGNDAAVVGTDAAVAETDAAFVAAVTDLALETPFVVLPMVISDQTIVAAAVEFGFAGWVVEYGSDCPYAS